MEKEFKRILQSVCIECPEFRDIAIEENIIFDSYEIDFKLTHNQKKKTILLDIHGNYHYYLHPFILNI